MAIALLEQDQGRNALSLLEQAVQRYPNNGRLKLQLGIFMLGLGDREAALRWLSEAARLDAQNPETQIAVGRLLQEQGNLVAAETLYRRAAALTDDSPQAQMAIGDLLLDQEAYLAAVVAYRRALELAPNNPDLYFRLGLALSGRDNRAGEAITALQMARELYGRRGDRAGSSASKPYSMNWTDPSGGRAGFEPVGGKTKRR